MLLDIDKTVIEENDISNILLAYFPSLSDWNTSKIRINFFIDDYKKQKPISIGKQSSEILAFESNLVRLFLKPKRT